LFQDKVKIPTACSKNILQSHSKVMIKIVYRLSIRNISKRERLNIIWRFRVRGLLKPSKYRHMGAGGLAKLSYNFYCGWKRYSQFL